MPRWRPTVGPQKCRRVPVLCALVASSARGRWPFPAPKKRCGRPPGQESGEFSTPGFSQFSYLGGHQARGHPAKPKKGSGLGNAWVSRGRPRKVEGPCSYRCLAVILWRQAPLPTERTLYACPAAIEESSRPEIPSVTLSPLISRMYPSAVVPPITGPGPDFRCRFRAARLQRWPVARHGLAYNTINRGLSTSSIPLARIVCQRRTDLIKNVRICMTVSTSCGIDCVIPGIICLVNSILVMKNAYS